MRILSRWLAAMFLVTFSLAASPGHATTEHHSPATCDGTWQVVPSANVGRSSYLEDVSADSATDAWAVGEWDGADGYARTLVEHWDGVSWTVVSSPSPGPLYSLLTDVVALSPTDVWAVGIQAGVSAQQTLTEHWDGTSWSVVPSVDVGKDDNQLFGVTAFGTDDVWAVGQQFSTQGSLLTEHWDGTAWTRVPADHRANSSHALVGIAGAASDDVWAVGDTTTIGGGPFRTLAEHWDGSAWTIVPTVNPKEKNENQLTDVTALFSNEAWAVGYYQVSATSILTLIEHWDGTTWQLAANPNATTLDYLFGVSGDAAWDVWAVGNAIDDGISQTLIEHYNGVGWTIVPSHDPYTQGNWLEGVSARASDDVWAVGYGYSGNNPTRTIIERLC